jgi:hypothetical protein
MALALFSSLAVAVQAATVTATVMESAGKVEYQLPGKGWKPAKVGDTLPKGTIVSTGFKSTVLLKVGPSTVTVKPITRLSLEEILQSESGTQTQLFLLAGRVKAEVTPQKGSAVEFQVKSPTATASVRGTGFEFDGTNLLVEHGSVQLRAPHGMTRYVRNGEFSYVATNGSVTSPAAVSAEGGLERVDELIDQADSDSRVDVDLSGAIDVAPTATVVITIQ